MYKIDKIGSIYRGTEHFYITKYFDKNNHSVAYIARDDREIFQIKEAINEKFLKSKFEPK